MNYLLMSEVLKKFLFFCIGGPYIIIAGIFITYFVEFPNWIYLLIIIIGGFLTLIATLGGLPYFWRKGTKHEKLIFLFLYLIGIFVLSLMLAFTLDVEIVT